MRIGAIIQARYASVRLPGKVLLRLPHQGRATVLAQVIRRLKRSKRLNDIIVATTHERNAAGIIAVAKSERVKYFRGDVEDVLSRYYLAARENALDIVVRITADCPCIDPKIVDLIIERHAKAKADYTSNTLNRTFPNGICVEVFNFDALETAQNKAKKNYEREHVTPYIYTRPSIFRIVRVKAPGVFYAPDIRITLDTEDDYMLLCAVFDFLYPRKRYFDTIDIIKLFREKPWLRLINRKIVQKKITYTLKEELKEAARVLDLQGLRRAKDLIKKRESSGYRV